MKAQLHSVLIKALQAFLESSGTWKGYDVLFGSYSGYLLSTIPLNLHCDVTYIKICFLVSLM